MKPHKMTMFLETLIEIAMHVGHSKLVMEDSRNLVDTILDMANEFEKKHKRTEWDVDKDFIEEVGDFSREAIEVLLENGTFGAKKYPEKVLITIEQGVVQSVTTTSSDIRVGILDYDKDAIVEEDQVLFTEWTDQIQVAGYDFWEVLYRQGDGHSDNELKAQSLLKAENF